jgi:hypothetical protein
MPYHGHGSDGFDHPDRRNGRFRIPERASAVSFSVFAWSAGENRLHYFPVMLSF